MDYKQQKRQRHDQQPRPSSGPATYSAHSILRCHYYENDGNTSGGSGGGSNNSTVNTAFLFLYHIAWRLHGFLDKKKASISSCSFVTKTMDGSGELKEYRAVDEHRERSTTRDEGEHGHDIDTLHII